MPKFAANLSLLFTEHPFAERFAAASAAGFKYVEYQYPYELAKEQVAQALRDNGLIAVLHNLPPVTRTACDPAHVADFHAGLEVAIEYAKAAGCGQLNCLAGNLPDGVDERTGRATLVANLRHAADALKREGIRLLIEAINTRDVPGFYLNRTRQAVDLIEAVGSDNLFLQYDVYHMQVMEGDLARTIEAYLPLISHIQVSDNPAATNPAPARSIFPSCSSSWIASATAVL
ncbi:MAG: TIM barrel protein [Rhodospirillales bacterium]